MLSFKKFLTETEHGKCLTKGGARDCFENARKEYHAQKAAGNNPKYHVGHVIGFGKDDDPQKHPQHLIHAWVSVNGKIHDPTPFKHGLGNFDSLPSIPAHEYWKPGTKYHSSYEVGPEKLHNELKTFPKKD